MDKPLPEKVNIFIQIADPDDKVATQIRMDGCKLQDFKAKDVPFNRFLSFFETEWAAQ